MMKKHIIIFQLIAVIVALAFSAYAEQPAEDATKRIKNSIEMEFILIQPGSFIMGSPEDENGRYKGEISHPVNLKKAFYIQTTEVTQGQWMSVMKKNPSSNKGCGDNCPVEQVSWGDAQKFIQKLNQKEGTDKYRLPTEAEWEYASRAEETSAFQNGNITELGYGRDPNLDAIGWYSWNSKNKTQSVAQKKANLWGLHDMAGNVQEWCQDWFGPYPYDEVTNPKGSPSGSYRVMRGGAFYSPARDCRSASRFGSPPHYRFQHIGLRLCRTP
jgi:formylglycine-generating enzyme required for sulfatase activity